MVPAAGTCLFAVPADCDSCCTKRNPVLADKEKRGKEKIAVEE